MKHMRDIEDLFNIWCNACRSYYFDEELSKAHEAKKVGCFIYLSSGQEFIAASIAEAFRGLKPNIFCQHRGHAAYISFGGDLVKLRDELLNGYGGDPMISDPKINFFGHSGLVADQVPLAVGYAFASGEPTICFLGDSTVEEDTFWPAVGFAVTHHAPVLFVCENNGLSVITRIDKRRTWGARQVAEAYNLFTHEIMDEPKDILAVAQEFLGSKPIFPTFVEIQCCRKYRHVGTGVDSEMAWNRMEIVRQQLVKIDPDRTVRIAAEAREEMIELWK